MSKVNEYLDTKTKAKHRMRRQESRSKKLTRFRRFRNHEYFWFKSGYIPNEYSWYLSADECIINGHGHLRRYGCTSKLKECKRTTSRMLRRHVILDEENYVCLNRNAYKRLYDLDSALL